MDEKSKVADPKLLMEIMELREQIEEASSPSDIKSLVHNNRQAMDAVKVELKASYESRDFPKMVELTNRLQYLSKADYEARERLDQLEEQAARGGGKQASSA